MKGIIIVDHNQLKRIVLVGDSLTEYGNWDELLKGFPVLNLGVSGETSLGLYKRIDLIKGALKDGDRVFLMTGINDILMDEEDVLPHISKALDCLKDIEGLECIIIQTILPVCYEFAYYLEAIRENNARILELAKRLDIGCLDVYSCFLDNSGKPQSRLFLEDGVHLSKEGYDVWAEKIRETI